MADIQKKKKTNKQYKKRKTTCGQILRPQNTKPLNVTTCGIYL